MSAGHVGPSLGPPHHTAYVVDNIASTVERLVAQLGAGPFLLIEDVPLVEVRSQGSPAELAHNSAFGAHGGHPIELMEIKHAAPELVRARFDGPRPRVHHFGYSLDVASAETVRAALDGSGAPAYLSSRLDGPRTSLHDGSESVGHDIEIIEDGAAFREFFAMVVNASEGWDGSEPLRSVAA